LYLIRPKANILINNYRHACLADFGLSTITGVATHATTVASNEPPISNGSTHVICRWGFSNVVDLKRHAHVIYRWGDPPVDES
jgi:hypothetical protein